MRHFLAAFILALGLGASMVPVAARAQVVIGLRPPPHRHYYHHRHWHRPPPPPRYVRRPY